MMKNLYLFFCTGAIITCSLLGCAHMTSQTSTANKDGTTTTTKLSVTAVFDSQTALAKGANHVTDKTSGTTLSGLDQSASGTNFVSSLQEVTKIISAIPK